MGIEAKTRRDLLREIEKLQARVAEAEETLLAIRGGEVDALVVSTESGDRVYTLTGADYPYRLLVETMTEGAVTLDENGTVFYCNQRLAQMIRTPLDTILGHPFREYLNREDWVRFEAHVRKGSHNCTRMETCLRASNQTLVPVLLSVSTREGVEAGGTISMIVTDLTKQKRDEAILSSLHVMGQILDQTSEILIICNETGQIVRASRSASSFLGYNPVGFAFDEAFPLDDMPLGLLSATGGGQPRLLEAVYNRRSGETSYFLVSISHLDGQAGGRGFVIIMVDVSERKRAEVELKEKSAHLEAANRELDSFAFSVAHDLRAPLRAIEGFARMILRKGEGEFDSETARRFNIILENAQKMGTLIDNLLAFSRLGRQEITWTDLDVEGIVREVWGELSALSTSRQLSFSVSGLLPGRGDRPLVKQVYANLLGNALKFTKNRDLAIIETGSYTEGNRVVYFVRDNGVGFDMAYSHKLFGVFQRLHGPEFEGTGAGLAIVRRIILKHGGTVWANARVNEGATFYFSLPCSDGDAKTS